MSDTAASVLATLLMERVELAPFMRRMLTDPIAQQRSVYAAQPEVLAGFDVLARRMNEMIDTVEELVKIGPNPMGVELQSLKVQHQRLRNCAGGTIHPDVLQDATGPHAT